MTLRSYVACWWKDDPAVTACPACGCPIQGRDRGQAMAAHYGIVHPGRPVIINSPAGVS